MRGDSEPDPVTPDAGELHARELDTGQTPAVGPRVGAAHRGGAGSAEAHARDDHARDDRARDDHARDDHPDNDLTGGAQAGPRDAGRPDADPLDSGQLDSGQLDSGLPDEAPLGIEPTGESAAELDRQPLAPTGEAEVAGATTGVTGVLAEERTEPRSHRRSRDGSTLGHVREPEMVNLWRSWVGRSAVLLFGVLLLGTAFIASYVGALHDPTPRDLPVAVVTGDIPAQKLLAATTPALAAREYPNATAATDALAERRVYAILATDGSSTAGGLSLTLAGAAAPGATDAIAQAVTAAAGLAQVPLAVADSHPLSTGDPRGLTAFYTVVGLLVGGYLAATVLAIVLGTVPRDLDRLGLRLSAFALFSLLLGLAAATLVGPVYDIWTRHFLGLWLAGALIAFVGALVTAALESWLGLVGTGLAMLLLFILGNPGSGGVFAPQFLPGVYGSMHWWNPTGMATDLMRGVAYFDRRAIGWPVLGLVLWAVAAIVGVLGATAVLGRRVHENR